MDPLLFGIIAFNILSLVLAPLLANHNYDQMLDCDGRANYNAMDLTKHEEDYMKALFHLIVEGDSEKAGTNQLAEYLKLSPASVNSMLKKLKKKALVAYEKYGKLELTKEGTAIAMRLIRKHRLWETFLHDHMNFSWEEVHDVAEQLEHIQSPKLIRELDRFLGYPKRDPHGAVIPTEEGAYEVIPQITLAEMEPGKKCKLTSVRDSSASFLKYVSKVGLALTSEILVEEIQDFDGSMLIQFNDRVMTVTQKFAEHVFVEPI